MRIVAISDTHEMHDQIELPSYQKGDVLVFAGDMTGRGSLVALTHFSEWLHKLPYEKIIVVAGNHDFCFQENFHIAKNILTKNENKVVYLQDEYYEYKGISFYGSPWSLEFHNWAFNATESELNKKWEQVPYVDVLITHGPPKGHLGGSLREVCSGKEVITDLGCNAVRDLIERIKPQFYICGHIHDGYGAYDEDWLDTVVINAAVCTEAYKPTNPPIVFEVV